MWVPHPIALVSFLKKFRNRHRHTEREDVRRHREKRAIYSRRGAAWSRLSLRASIGTNLIHTLRRQ